MVDTAVQLWQIGGAILVILVGMFIIGKMLVKGILDDHESTVAAFKLAIETAAQTHRSDLIAFREELKSERDQCRDDHEKMMVHIIDIRQTLAEIKAR